MKKLVCFDIDGVLTDGSVYVDENGNESKKYRLTEIDTINDIKSRGYWVAAITGEEKPIVDVFKSKVKWDYFIVGSKNKDAPLETVIKELKIGWEDVFYIGDGKYDVPCISKAGMGICPSNATQEVKSVADYVMSGKGGDNCVSEFNEYLKLIEKNAQTLDASDDAFSALFNKNLDRHLSMFRECLSNRDFYCSMQMASKIVLQSVRSGGAIYLCGNGGSAADAQHIATEFVSRFYLERKAINAEALTVNTSSLTAIGNDYDFARVFARQLEAKGKPGDVLIGISTSGRSDNVIKAMKFAKGNGIRTVLLTGGHKGQMEGVFDCVVKMPSTDTPRIQEGHIFVGHMMAEYVEKNMAEGRKE